MTIKDVCAVVGYIKAARPRPTEPSHLTVQLFHDVLVSIANSSCQDSPAELAAEALKVFDPLPCVQSADAHLGANRG